MEKVVPLLPKMFISIDKQNTLIIKDIKISYENGKKSIIDDSRRMGNR